MASCKAGGVDWKVGIDGGKYGPMGEDLFAQTCLDANGVKRGIGYGSKLDGTCEADRPLEEKKNKKWKPSCDTARTQEAAAPRARGLEGPLPRSRPLAWL